MLAWLAVRSVRNPHPLPADLRLGGLPYTISGLHRWLFGLCFVNTNSVCSVHSLVHSLVHGIVVGGIYSGQLGFLINRVSLLYIAYDSGGYQRWRGALFTFM